MTQNVRKRHRALIADDEETLRLVLGQLLIHEGCEVDEVTNGEDAVRMAAVQPYDLYIFDMKMPRLDGMETLKRVRQAHPNAMVVMVTAYGSQKMAIEALRAGAYDYFTKPFEMEELQIILRRALEKQALLKKVDTLQRHLGEQKGFHRMIGDGEAMRKVFNLIQRISGHDITALITGESGVGKELVAEAIHEMGLGADKPFIRINCAAIPEPLLESELFGHERGAFTGAVASKPGKFELADGGSILLDEIGEMPLSLQAKLLRVIQEKKVERIGDTRVRKINVRIIASTNRDLTLLVKEKRFREDLFFRINVVSIHVPPLRERIEDIPPLVDHFIIKHGLRGGGRVTGVTPNALKLIESYAWPGNVRELENIIQRSIIMTGGDMIDTASLSPVIAGGEAPGAAIRQEGAGDVIEQMDEIVIRPLAEQIDRLVQAEEKRMIQLALKKMKDRRQESADLLGISRKSLHNKMQKYGLLKNKS